MADAYLKEYANILLEDGTSKLLAENLNIFVTDGSSPLITDRFLMEDGLGVYLLEAGAVITETIIGKDFLMLYRAEPVTSKELRSRVSGATITKVAKEYPQTLLKSGKVKELRSRWS